MPRPKAAGEGLSAQQAGRAAHVPLLKLKSFYRVRSIEGQEREDSEDEEPSEQFLLLDSEKIMSSAASARASLDLRSDEADGRECDDAAAT